MVLNASLLLGKMAERGESITSLCEKIGCDPSTFHRKMKSGGNGFTLMDVGKIQTALVLTKEETREIFIP